MHRSIVLLVLLAAACCGAARVELEDDAPDASQWGSFRGQRVNAAAVEHKKDLAEAKKELKRAIAFGKAYCAQTKQISKGPLARAQAKIELFRSLLSQRKALLRFHEKRVRVYAKRREYFASGPARLRDYVKTCGGRPRSSCVAEWCARNQRACESWKLAALEYREGNYEQLREAQLASTSAAARRVQAAKAKLQRAVQARERVRRQAEARVQKCSTFVRESLRPQYRRINALKSGRERLAEEGDAIDQRRTDRQLAYKDFNFTRCRRLGGHGVAGRHHAYLCRRDPKSQQSQAFRFHRCKRQTKAGHFRCWK